jgi:hypothetical protein
VDVDIELDTEPLEVEVPADLAEALAADDAARQAFEKLAYSHRLRHVLAIEEAKAPETRRRRIDKALEILRAGQCWVSSRSGQPTALRVILARYSWPSACAISSIG